MDRKLIHICEVCGKTEILTPEEAFNDGWDYPPRMGSFGIVGPRTCGACPINLTVWWALVSEKKSVAALSQKQRETIKRIQGEPESIMPKEEEIMEKCILLSREQDTITDRTFLKLGWK